MSSHESLPSPGSSPRAGSDRARYIMVGGFLGAGKTTAVARLAAYLKAEGRSVGLITNDQSSGLVDSSILRSKGFAVEEIAGGCFCCRFDSLSDAVGKLTEETKPDVFLAEPVGSCTDLLATVSYPLRRLYGDRYAVAPLSVLVDPSRAARVLGLEEGRSFSPKVVYVYEKQLEEADVIVVNKCDAHDAKSIARLTEALRTRFPRSEVLAVSAKDGAGIEAWFERILESEGSSAPTMDVDYEVYAEGEALLGWLNETLELDPGTEFDANELVRTLCLAIRDRLLEVGAEIAHLKMTLDARLEDGQLAVASLVTSEGEPDLREALFDRVSGGALIVNLRAEADPDELVRLTEEVQVEVLGKMGLKYRLEHREHFRPAAPVPVHRDVVAAGQMSQAGQVNAPQSGGSA